MGDEKTVFLKYVCDKCGGWFPREGIFSIAGVLLCAGCSGTGKVEPKHTARCECGAAKVGGCAGHAHWCPCWEAK